MKDKVRIEDLIDITKDELKQIKKSLKDGERITLFRDSEYEIKLFKIGRKVYEVIARFGDKPFSEVFKDMVKVKHAGF